MLKINYIFTLLFILLLIASCKKGTNPIIPVSNTFLYPLEVGNKWEYDRHIATYNYRSKDSINYPRYDDSVHYHSKINVEVVREEIILDSIETFIVKSLETETSMQSFWSEHYYKNEADGLLLVAYSNYGGGANGLPKQINSQKIIFKGIEFNSISEITQTLDHILPRTYNVSTDSILYEIPAIKILEYPLSIYNEWIFRLANNPFGINKRVLGKESISLSSQIFSCYKIKWLYDLDNNNKWDEDISVIDFIADEGLIKRVMIVKNLAITTAVSPDGNGYFDWSEEIKLANTNL